MGGRDLSAAVGGLSTRPALAPRRDPSSPHRRGSKPPATAVADALEGNTEGRRPRLTWPAGAGDPTDGRGRRGARRLVGRREVADLGATGGVASAAVRGLFVGGTLCDEAMLVVERLGPVRSTSRSRRAGLPRREADGHLMVDLGDDRLTEGRAHLIIDPDAAARAPRTAR